MRPILLHGPYSEATCILDLDIPLSRRGYVPASAVRVIRNIYFKLIQQHSPISFSELTTVISYLTRIISPRFTPHEKIYPHS